MKLQEVESKLSCALADIEAVREAFHGNEAGFEDVIEWLESAIDNISDVLEGTNHA